MISWLCVGVCSVVSFLCGQIEVPEASTYADLLLELMRCEFCRVAEVNF